MANFLVEFSLDDGRRGKLVTSAPSSATENLAERRGDRVCNSHGEISAQEIFAPLNDPAFVRKIQKLVLSTKSFTLPAAQMVCEKIRQMTELRVIDISDTISGIMEAEAEPVLNEFGKALEGLPKLEELHCNRNALGPRVVAFARVLTGRLTAVTFCVTGMSASACDIAAKAFLHNGPLPLRLRTLHFAESTSNSGGAIAISTLLRQCAYLQDFRLASVRSAADGMAAICRELQGARPPIQVLDLSDNNFKDGTVDAGPVLGAALSELAPTLRRLKLNSIGLGADGYRSLHNGLAACDSLEALSLDDFDVIAFSAVPQFAQLLGAGLPALAELSISEFFVGEEGAAALADALDARSQKANRAPLSILDLHMNNLTDEGIAVLFPAIVRMTSTRGGSAGFSTNGLRLDENELSEGAVAFIRSVFEEAGRADELASLEGTEDGDTDATFAPVRLLKRVSPAAALVFAPSAVVAPSTRAALAGSSDDDSTGGVANALTASMAGVSLSPATGHVAGGSRATAHHQTPQSSRNNVAPLSFAAAAVGAGADATTTTTTTTGSPARWTNNEVRHHHSAAMPSTLKAAPPRVVPPPGSGRPLRNNNNNNNNNSSGAPSSALEAAAATFVRDCQNVRNRRDWPAAVRGRTITVTQEVDVGGGCSVLFSTEVSMQ